MKTLVLFAVIAAMFALPLPAQVKPLEAGDRTAVSITVYNQNLSLVREERTINFPGGTSTIVIPDIPATIDATSINFTA